VTLPCNFGLLRDNIGRYFKKRVFQQREEHWVISDVKGIAGRTRTIKMPGWEERESA
jgi:hypothetical protein